MSFSSVFTFTYCLFKFKYDIRAVIALFICVCNFVLICSLILYTPIRPCPWVSGSWVSGSRVTGVMGHMGHGSQKMTHCQLWSPYATGIARWMFLLVNNVSNHCQQPPWATTKVWRSSKPIIHCVFSDVKNAWWTIRNWPASRHTCQRIANRPPCDNNAQG